MLSFIKNLYYSSNEVATKYFFHFVDFLTISLAYLNAGWVYMIFTFVLLVVSLKIYMGVVLTSHLVGKLIFIVFFLMNSLPYTHYMFRDFKLGLFSWSELCLFLVFSFQVVVMLITGIYDFLNYVLYHRHGIPCNYFAERLDTSIENILLYLFHFFSDLFHFFSNLFH